MRRPTRFFGLLPAALCQASLTIRQIPRHITAPLALKFARQRGRGRPLCCGGRHRWDAERRRTLSQGAEPGGAGGWRGTAASPVLSGGRPGPHQIQGIGAGFIPENFNRHICDEIVAVSDEDALTTGRELAVRKGFWLAFPPARRFLPLPCSQGALRTRER